MSSLKATQADGYYIPPDYTNSGAYKKQSLNQFNTKKTHTGHNQYLKNSTVRFELPCDGFCLSRDCIGVAKTIKRGTRFNAQKSHAGDYHSTKIWEFAMKCRVCQHPFVIRTNPQQKTFDYISGIKKRVDEFDTVENQSLGVLDTENGHAIYNFTNGRVVNDGDDDDNIIDELQKQIVGKRKATTEHERMERVMNRNNSTMYDDATSNSNLRATFRIKRKQKKKHLEYAAKLGLGAGVLLQGDGGSGADVAMSRCAFEEKRKHHAKEKERQTFLSIREGIFGKGVAPIRRAKQSNIAGCAIADKDENDRPARKPSRKTLKPTVFERNLPSFYHGHNMCSVKMQTKRRGNYLQLKRSPIAQKGIEINPSEFLSVPKPVISRSGSQLELNVEQSSSLAALSANHYGSDSD